jgi:protein gp37
MSQEWVRKIRAECRGHGIPFFFKQWGGVRKLETGRTLDGKVYDEFPKMEHNVVASLEERTMLLSAMGA